MKTLFIFFLLFNAPLYVQAGEKKLKTKGKAFNPNIGLNALFLSQYSNGNSSEDGMKIQEVELQMSSDIDAYFTAVALLAIEEENGIYNIEPEEVFIESLTIPYITLTIGKMSMPMGKHNQLHLHAFPFINAPLANEAVLGEEGLNEAGFSVSGLLPLPWFSEFNLVYAQGENDELFNRDKKNSNLLVARLQNLWDLSKATTLDIGYSWAQGENTNNLDTTLQGADVTLKWRPTKGGKYHSFEWMTEFLQREKKGEANGYVSGFVSSLKFQFARRWYAQYRYDKLGLSESQLENPKRNTGLIAFLPSEFSGIRLQYEAIANDGTNVDEKRASLQFNMSIGAHAAHKY